MTTATRAHLIARGLVKPRAAETGSPVKADALAIESRQKNLRGKPSQRALEILQQAQARRVITYVKHGVRRQEWL